MRPDHTRSWEWMACQQLMFVTTSPTSVLLTTTSLYLAYSHPPVGTEYHSIMQRHLFCFMSSDAFFSFSWAGGWTTTCMVVTPPGISHNGLLHSATVLLFSNILPALINLTSFTVRGPLSFSIHKICLRKHDLETCNQDCIQYLRKDYRKKINSRKSLITKRKCPTFR